MSLMTMNALSQLKNDNPKAFQKQVDKTVAANLKRMFDDAERAVADLKAAREKAGLPSEFYPVVWARVLELRKEVGI